MTILTHSLLIGASDKSEPITLRPLLTSHIARTAGQEPGRGTTVIDTLSFV